MDFHTGFHSVIALDWRENGGAFALACADGPGDAEPSAVLTFDACWKAAEALRLIEVGDARGARALARHCCTGYAAHMDWVDLVDDGADPVAVLDRAADGSPVVTTCDPGNAYTSPAGASFARCYGFARLTRP